MTYKAFLGRPRTLVTKSHIKWQACSCIDRIKWEFFIMCDSIPIWYCLRDETRNQETRITVMNNQWVVPALVRKTSHCKWHRFAKNSTYTKQSVKPNLKQKFLFKFIADNMSKLHYIYKYIYNITYDIKLAKSTRGQEHVRNQLWYLKMLDLEQQKTKRSDSLAQHWTSSSMFTVKQQSEPYQSLSFSLCYTLL